MIHRPIDRWPCRAVAAVSSLLFAYALGPPPIRAEAVGKRDLRQAQTAVREGRLDQALQLYERILESSTNDELRFESLYDSTLILLSSEPPGPIEKARQRLDALEATSGPIEPGRKLVISALAAQVGASGALEARIQELEQELVSASEAAEVALQEARERCAETLEEQVALVASKVDESTLLTQRLEISERHRATREDELQDTVEELARCRAEMKFLLDQLAGTQASEVQMLEVVMQKNEELTKARRELERREGELAERTLELEAKQDEIRKREEAIREVAERVLGKESPDS